METIWWCEFHRAGGDWTWRPGLDCWGAGLGGQDDCDMVERVLSVPGELADPANPADILAAVRTLPGVEEVVVGVKYGAVPIMEKGPFFVDIDYEIASELDAGRYLVIPLPEGEEK